MITLPIIAGHVDVLLNYLTIVLIYDILLLESRERGILWMFVLWLLRLKQ